MYVSFIFAAIFIGYSIGSAPVVGYDAELTALTALTRRGLSLFSLSFLITGFNIFGSAFFTALGNGVVSAAISFLRKHYHYL